MVLDGTDKEIQNLSFNDGIYSVGNPNVDTGKENENAKNMAILKVNGDLIINEGVTLTACKNPEGYGGTKGLLIFCTGRIINNGKISMTERGAKAEGQNVYLWKNTDDTYEYVPAQGEMGGEGFTGPEVCPGISANRIYFGNTGTDAQGRKTGGGGAGSAHVWEATITKVGSGSAGTSYSGGTGGGASSGYRGYVKSGYDALTNGGKGGAGGEQTFESLLPTGGAGNPNGDSYNSVNSTKSGTGGLLMIYAEQVLGDTGIIESNGSMAENQWACTGGGSGAGSINILTKSFSEKIQVTAIGVTNDNSKAPGGRGGNGSITIGDVSTGSFIQSN